MPFTFLLGFLKGNWLKIGGYLIVLAVVGYGVHRGYDWVYERGVAHQAGIDKPIIDKANADRTAAINEKNTYVASYNKFVGETTSARQLAEAAHRQEVADLTAKLDQAHTANSKLTKDLHDALASYVTPAMDATYSIPLGFVSLYNQSIQASGSGAYVAVAGSSGFLASAPSGLTASYTAGVIANNNAECVERGQVIAGWQQWYHDHQAIFGAALKAEHQTVPHS